MVADTHDLPEPCTECMVSSVSIRLGGSAGPLAAGVGYATELVATAPGPRAAVALPAAPMAAALLGMEGNRSA